MYDEIIKIKLSSERENVIMIKLDVINKIYEKLEELCINS